MTHGAPVAARDEAGAAEMRASGGAPRGLRARVRARVRAGELGPWPVLVGLALIWLAFQSQNEHFLTPRNLSNLILQIGVLGTLGVGVVLVLLLGEIDLSLGAVAGVCAGVLGVLVTTHHWPSAAAIAATLAVGALIGLLQGTTIVLIGVPSFVVTLAGLLAWQGVQLILLGDVGELLIQDTTIRNIASAYLSPLAAWILGLVVVAGYAVALIRRRGRRLRAGLDAPWRALVALQIAVMAAIVAALIALLNSYFGVPYILALLVGVVLAFSWLLGRTIFGRHVYAIGGGAEAARRAGIRVGAVRVAVFTLTSTLAALAGILSASRQFAVSTGTGGGTLLLEAIAAAVIGGVSLFGGRGWVYQAVLGALVIGSVENGLDLLGQPASTKDVATGVILVIAVGIDALSRRRRQAR